MPVILVNPILFFAISKVTRMRRYRGVLNLPSPHTDADRDDLRLEADIIISSASYSNINMEKVLQSVVVYSQYT